MTGTSTRYCDEYFSGGRTIGPELREFLEETVEASFRKNERYAVQLDGYSEDSAAAVYDFYEKYENKLTLMLQSGETDEGIERWARVTASLQYLKVREKTLKGRFIAAVHKHLYHVEEKGIVVSKQVGRKQNSPTYWRLAECPDADSPMTDPADLRRSIAHLPLTFKQNKQKNSYGKGTEMDDILFTMLKAANGWLAQTTITDILFARMPQESTVSSNQRNSEGENNDIMESLAARRLFQGSSVSGIGGEVDALMLEAAETILAMKQAIKQADKADKPKLKKALDEYKNNLRIVLKSLPLVPEDGTPGRQSGIDALIERLDQEHDSKPRKRARK